MMRPLEKMCFNHVGPLPEMIEGKRFIAVGIDVFTRFVVAKPTKDLTAGKFVKFFSFIGSTFGWPDILVTDNARAFDNREMRELCSQHSIVHQFAASRHHHGNAPVDRAIQSLTEKLTMLMKEEPATDWSAAVQSMKSRVSRTKYAPFTLMFGRPAPMMLSTLILEQSSDA